MIVKNEEANLARCLRSVAGAVDEIVVVDTGSQDRTIEIAKSFGATVVEWAWRDDFAAARNVSLDHATGDWILFLDADEELFREDRESLRELLLDDSSDGFFLLETNYGGERPGFDQVTSATLRLFRNRPEYRFAGAIHEQIMPAIVAQGGRLKRSQVRLRHYGYLDEAIQAQDKIERNLRIAKAEVGRQPNSAFALFNLGMEYLRIHEHEKALAVNRKAFLHLPDLTVPYASRLLRNILVSLTALKRYDEAFKVLADAVKAYPDYTDLFYQRGLIYLEQRDFPRAAEAFRVCLEMGDAGSRYISDAGVGSYRAHFGLGYALEMMGDFRGAVSAYEESLKECRVLPGPAYRLASLLLKVASPDAVLGTMIRLVGERDPGSLAALAIAFREARHYRHALALVEQAGLLASDNQQRQLKGELLLHLGRYRESAQLLAHAADEDGKSSVFAALALLMAGEFDAGQALLNRSDAVPGAEGWGTVLRHFADLLTGRACAMDIEPLTSAERTQVSERIWTLLGFLLETKEYDKFEQALGLLNLLELSELERRLQLGKLYYSHGFEESAIEELTRLAPSELDADAAEILARILDARGMVEETLAFYQAAVERDAGNPQRYLLLSRRASELGRVELAGEAVRSGLRRFPGHEGLLSMAARLAQGLGNATELMPGLEMGGG